jgi:hypothetical protein
VSSTAASPFLAAATHGSDLAATVHTLAQAATVALIVIIAVAFYLLTCAIWPFGKCRRCKGLGKFKSPFGNAYRQCDKCQGSGLRIRLGRHVINHLRATHKAGDK